MFFWLQGVAVLTFALTLNFKLMWIVFASSFLVYFVTVRVIKKRAAQSASNA